jgi:hypothetical protein
MRRCELMSQMPVILSGVDRETINAVEGSAVAFYDAGNKILRAQEANDAHASAQA